MKDDFEYNPQKRRKELLELIAANPDVPIYAWVNSDVVGGDYGYWTGEFDMAEIREFAEVEPFDCLGNMTNQVFKDEDYYYDFLVNNGKTPEEARKIVDGLDYKKAIFVYVEL